MSTMFYHADNKGNYDVRLAGTKRGFDSLRPLHFESIYVVGIFDPVGVADCPKV